MRIEDVKKSLSEMSTQELVFFIKTIRDKRREAKFVDPKKTTKAAKQSAVDKLLKGLNQEDRDKLIAQLEAEVGNAAG